MKLYWCIVYARNIETKEKNLVFTTKKLPLAEIFKLTEIFEYQVELLGNANYFYEILQSTE